MGMLAMEVPRSARHADHRDDLYNEVGICSARCRQCIHSGTESTNAVPYCQYILDTGHRRPCPAGKDCTSYEKRYKRKPKCRLYAVEITCQKCGKKFQSASGNKRFCSDCYQEAEKERQKIKRHQAVLDRQAEKMKKERICKWCGATFHAPTNRIVFCEKCRNHQWEKKK